MMYWTRNTPKIRIKSVGGSWEQENNARGYLPRLFQGLESMRSSEEIVAFSVCSRVERFDAARETCVLCVGLWTQRNFTASKFIRSSRSFSRPAFLHSVTKGYFIVASFSNKSLVPNRCVPIVSNFIFYSSFQNCSHHRLSKPYAHTH